MRWLMAIAAVMVLLVGILALEASPAEAQLGSSGECTNYDPGQYCHADVNCDNRLSIADAVIVAQYIVGLRNVVTSCAEYRNDPVGSIMADFINTGGVLHADLNNDGRIGIGDAVSMTQCQVGISNPNRDCLAKSPVSFANPVTQNSYYGLGSTFASEYSGATVNADLDRLLIVDGNSASLIASLQLVDGDPVTPATVFNFNGAEADIEGISWMYGDTYAVIHENGGQTQSLSVVELNHANGNVNVLADDVNLTFDDSLSGSNGGQTNKGAEGVAFIPGTASQGSLSGARFVVVKEETPPKAYQYTLTGSGANWTLTEDSEHSFTFMSSGGDVSGVAIVPHPTNIQILITSDDDSDLFFIDNLTGTTINTPTWTVNLPHEQAEGVAYDGDNIWVLGEQSGAATTFYARYALGPAPS